jgi:hypothetical protein
VWQAISGFWPQRLPILELSEGEKAFCATASPESASIVTEALSGQYRQIRIAHPMPTEKKPPR